MPLVNIQEPEGYECKGCAELREQLNAAQQQLTQARRDSDSLQHLYESTSVTESVIFGWKDRPVGSSAEAARTLLRRYEAAQQQIDTLTKERNDARHRVMELELEKELKK